MPTPARVVILPKDPGPLEVQEVRLPDPGPHQVVIKQFASGVCHSQLHQMHRPRETDVILGHESTGVVLAKGRAVDHVKEGDTVMVTWVVREGPRTARRPEGVELPIAGGRTAQARNVFTWADHTIADEQYVVKATPEMPKDVTAIIGCAVMTGAGAVLNSVGVKAGESVAVFGVGGVGLSAIVAAREAGAAPIIAVDLKDEKLAFAKRFGATHLVNASERDPIRAIHEITRHEDRMTLAGAPVSGADYAFDCIGLKATMEQILPAVRARGLGGQSGGTAVLVGVPNTSFEIDARDMLVNEKHYIGSLGGSCVPDEDFPKFVRWAEEGILDLDALVTERYAIDAINEATTALEEGRIAGRSILVF